MLNDLFAYVVVFTVLIVGITAYIETQNTKIPVTASKVPAVSGIF